MDNKIKIETEKWDVEVFTTTDGRRFTSDFQAVDWQEKIFDREIEKTLIIKKIPSNSFSFAMLSPDWYYVADEKQKDYLIRKFSKDAQWVHVNRNLSGDINIGDWVCPYYCLDEDDNMLVQKGLYTLDYLLSELSKFILASEKIL